MGEEDGEYYKEAEMCHQLLNNHEEYTKFTLKKLIVNHYFVRILCYKNNMGHEEVAE